MGTPHADIRELFAWNLSNPGTSSVFAADLAVNGKVPVVRITVVPSTTSIVSVEDNLGATTFTYALNDGTALTADQVYTFDLPAINGHGYNLVFTTSQTGGNVPVVMLQQYEA